MSITIDPIERLRALYAGYEISEEELDILEARGLIDHWDEITERGKILLKDK